MEPCVDLIFEGRIRDGFVPESVRDQLQKRLKTDRATIQRLFSGQRVILKHNLKRTTALQWVQTFHRFGAILKMEPVVPETAARPESITDMTCPKCGFQQAQAAECGRCGVIIAKAQQPQPPMAPPMAREITQTVVAPGVVQTRNFAMVVFMVGLVALLGAFFMKDRFPEKAVIDKQLYRQPVQTPSRALPFDTTVGDRSYHITPLFDYELKGLVVSQYDATGWWDITHRFLWQDNLNLKDICVVWGYNVITDVFREMRYKSGSWTCWAMPASAKARQFFGQCLSNNHLLTDDPAISRKILRTQRGDQISLRGYLATYRSDTGHTRGTSITREDAGNGACETIYVTDYQILHAPNRFWRALFFISGLAVSGAMAVFIGMLAWEYRATRNIKGGLRFSGQKFRLKIMAQLTLLLVLIWLWLQLHQ